MTIVFRHDMKPQNYLAKQIGMDLLAKLAGFVKRESTLVASGSDIQPCPQLRRHTIADLTDRGYLDKPPLGQKHYVVTDKAFNECAPLQYQGMLNIGSLSSPRATWLSGGIIKQAIEDLVAGDAKITDADNGRDKVVLLIRDARTEAEVFFDRHLAENLGALAADCTDMAKSFAECLKVPPLSVTSKFLERELTAMQKDMGKDIQRLKRTHDAITVFFTHVHASGGFKEFIKNSRKLVEDVNLRPAQKIAKGMSDLDSRARLVK